MLAKGDLMDTCSGVVAAALGLLCVACVLRVAPPMADYYVATDGCDAWSGTQSAPDGTKTDGPFATLHRARDAVRELKAGRKGRGPITVMVRAGTYYLSEPLRLGPEDSGTAKRPVIYCAYPDEEPVLSGGRAIVGWRKGTGKLWVADLPDVKAGTWYFRQLFVGNEPRVRARTPNPDPDNPITGGWHFVTPPMKHGRPLGAFGRTLVRIHTAGDWFEWQVTAPADGTYDVWLYYGALNKPHGRAKMDGRTSLRVDGGKPVLLENLPDTGGWSTFTWSRTAKLKLTAGGHEIRWTNDKGGGLNFDALVLCDDPAWNPRTTTLLAPGRGKHMILVQAEDYVACRTREGGVGAGSRGPGKVDRFPFRPGDLKRWARSPDAEIHIFPAWGWVNAILSLDRVDLKQHVAYVKNKNCTQDIRNGNRYFVANVREALDRPGEWFIDRAAGRLYYWPKHDDFARRGVVAPALDRLVDIAGDVDDEAEAEGQIKGDAQPAVEKSARRRWVTHITLRGFTFRHTRYSLEMANVYTPDDAAVWLRRAKHCTIENCTFPRVGGYAVRLSLSARHNHVLGNTITDAGQGGVLMVGYQTRTQPTDNTVAGNTIARCGRIWKHVAGVYVTTGSRNRIAHNTITDMPRYGISLKSFRKGSASHHNVVEYNDIRRTNLETNDTGAIETLGRDREDSGNVIRGNLILDSVGLKTTETGEFLTPFYTWGVYLDDYSSGTLVYGNIIARAYLAAAFVHTGRNNVFENNIFVDCHDQQFQCGGGAFMTNETFVRNIVCFRRGNVIAIHGGTAPVLSTCDHNLYWQVGADLARRTDAVTPKGTWAQWRAAGYDTHSRIADPLFVDPDHDDYRLKPDSPAPDLGFRSIDVSRIGVAGYIRPPDLP